MTAVPLSRRFGTPMWDGLVRGTGIVGVMALLASLWTPHAAALTTFVLITVWVHGPISPFLPAAYEPTLMLFGRLYPPLLIGVLGTLANLYVEFLDYHLFLKMADFAPYRRLQAHPLFARAVRLFAKRPFLTIWLFAWSPLPDWMVRVLAPAARYPVSRYLVALGLGRLPKFWLLAALGAHFHVPTPVLLTVAFGSALLTALAAAWKALAVRMRRVPGDLIAQPAVRTSLGTPGIVTP